VATPTSGSFDTVRGNRGNFQAGERHGDFFAVAGRAPDWHAHAALQDGVVLKQRVQFRRNSRRGESAKQNGKDFYCFFHGLKILPDKSRRKTTGSVLHSATELRPVVSYHDTGIRDFRDYIFDKPI
jgi:hypothetical protein